MSRTLKISHHNGEFYSPICDPDELKRDAARIWPESPQPLGIDFDDASHLHVLRDLFPRWMPEYDYPDTLTEDPVAGPTGFYTVNSQFGWLDARALFVLLREYPPKRIIEVGCGYSSLLMADVNQRFLGRRTTITCIEPYPREFLVRGVPGISRLVRGRVQDVPVRVFSDLESGDLLFIDSSHVCKTGSDVQFLYFEVLPRLAPGVGVQIHDIALPHDYCKLWAIEENRSWNEQYLLQAILAYSRAFRVLFGCTYAAHRFPTEVQRALALPDGRYFGGGSFWMIKN